MTRWLLLAAVVSLIAVSGCAWYLGPDDYIVGYSDYIYAAPPPPPPAYYPPPPVYYGPPPIYYHTPLPFFRFDFDFRHHGDRDQGRRDQGRRDYDRRGRR